MNASWPCPAAGGPGADYALACDRGREPERRLLIVPALFDEANRLRRFTVETMRELDRLGFDSILPDLPGTNESLALLPVQTLELWRRAMAAAADRYAAGRVLAIRAGALVAPALPGWHYAAVSGAAVLRQMLRARILAAREAGREESQAALLESGRTAGLELGGYPLGAEMIAQLQAAPVPPAPQAISQADIGGAGLWLRAEPDEDPEQSRRLARLIAQSAA